MGLTGDWGTGKTSLLELILYYLKRTSVLAQTSQHIHLEEYDDAYIPYSEVEYIVEDLHRANKNPSMSRAHIQGLFEKHLNDEYASANAFQMWLACEEERKEPRFIVLRFSPWVFVSHGEVITSFLLELGKAIGTRFGEEVQERFKKYAETYEKYGPVAAAGFDLLSGGFTAPIARTTAKVAKFIGSRLTEPTFESLKNQLDAALSLVQGRKVIIVFDDLDRLLPYEAVQIASLAKGLGNLPSVVYLMSYSEVEFSKQIARALAPTSEVRELESIGRRYLEKIVQHVEIPPPIPPTNLMQLYQDELLDLVASISGAHITVNPRDQRWLWQNVIQYYVRTPRDIYRLMNTLKVDLSASDTSLILEDLIVVKILALHEPDVYALIRTEYTNLS